MLHWSARTDARHRGASPHPADVRAGDAAVLEYTQRFDALVEPVAALELTQAENSGRARRHHARAAQRPESGRCARARLPRAQKGLRRSWSYRDADGTLLGQKVTPLDRVGIYVPGGKAAYPSSVLMNAIPAHVAGVRRDRHGRADAARRRTRWCWPPPRGRREPRLHHRRRAGGGALAYGTATVPAVDKITGPGNAWPWPAPRSACSAKVGIDMIAGPSEILVLADGSDAAGLGGDGPVQPGRARRAGAEHPAVPGRRPSIDAVQASIDRLLPACRAATSSAPRAWPAAAR